MPVRKQLKDQSNDNLVVQEGEHYNVSPIVFKGFLDSDPDTAVTLTKAQITSVKCWLFEDTNNVKINSRKDQEIKDENGGTMAADGTLSIASVAADNAIMNSLSEEATEVHVWRFAFSWNDGAQVRTGISEHFYEVEKLAVVADS